MHHDEPADKAVLPCKGAVANAPAKRSAVGPVVDYGDLRRVRATQRDQPLLHRLPQRNHARGAANQQAVYALQHSLDRWAAEILEEARYLREDVLAEEDERHPPAPGSGQGCQPEDRGVGQLITTSGRRANPPARAAEAKYET